MIGVLLHKPEELIVREIEKPVPKPGEILIKVRRVGICGSDIHAYYGKHPTIYLPVVQGHEFSGAVEALGEGVTGFAVGDAVTGRPQITCGKCAYCREEHENICKELIVVGCNGKVPGAAQEYIALPAKLVFKLPDALDFDDGAMVEPVAVAVAAVKSLSSRVAGKNILVLGAGTIGNLTAQVAKALGAKRVMITDLCSEKLAVAKACGIDYQVNTAQQNLQEIAREVFGADGLDAALECVGVEATVNDAIRAVRKRGDIVIAGIFSKNPAIRMIDVQEKELKIIGTLMYLAEDYTEAIRLIAEGSIQLDPLKTAHFKLRDFAQAYQFIAGNKDSAMKVLIDVNE